MRFTTRGIVVAVAAVAAAAIADAGQAANSQRRVTIVHCNQATQHCVNGTTPYNVNSQPPSATDRRGLMHAFGAAHPDRSHVALVGFRVVGPHSAAAYYLITGSEQSTYVSAHTDLFRRTHGSSWAHVKRFKNANPGWNDVDNLGPGFLWKATGDGSGTYVYQQTTAANDGSDTRTYNTQASFSWSFTYAGGHVLNLGNDTANASPSLAGQMSAGTADSSDPTQNAQCTGAVKDGGGGLEVPNMNVAQYPRDGKTKALDFTLALVDRLNWPSSCNSDWAIVPGDSRFVVGARVPVSVLESDGFYNPGGLKGQPNLNGQPFDLPVDDMSPTAAPDAKPHQGSSANDGSAQTTSNEDLKLAGTLHFKLVGLWMPLGWLGSPHPSLRADGKVPPVL
jgi:hypothetical protein